MVNSAFISSPSLQITGSAVFATPGSLFGGGGVYQKIWAGLKQLAADPFPQVSSMSESLLIYLKVKAREKERFSRLGSSILEGGSSPRMATPSAKDSPSGQQSTTSVPSSPARASFVVGNSPPPPSSTAMQQQQQQQQQADPASTGTLAMGQRTLSSDSNSSSLTSPQQGHPRSALSSASIRKIDSRSHNPSPTSTQTGRDLRSEEDTSNREGKRDKFLNFFFLVNVSGPLNCGRSFSLGRPSTSQSS